MSNTYSDKTALGLAPNIGALICYLGNLVCALGLIYSIIVIATDKTHRLTRFHAFQSILLSVGGFVIGLLYSFASGFLGLILGDLAILLVPISFLVFGVIGLAIFIFTIIAAIKAAQGEIYKIPVVGNFAEQFAG
jgi:uncharacterized membrane protein